MEYRKGFTLIELMVVVFILGLLAAIVIPNYMNLECRAKEASVKSNCHTVRLATEEFAVLNTGVYPTSHDGDMTFDGHCIIDLLPNGQLLENPFTKARTEPITAAEAQSEGEIAYSPFLLNGSAIGYSITGAGKAGHIVITLASGQ